MTAAELEKLLAEVTPGEWDVERQFTIKCFRKSFTVQLWSASRMHSFGDARLIAMAPALARRAIAAERMAEALRHMAAQFQHPDQMADEALAAYEAAK